MSRLQLFVRGLALAVVFPAVACCQEPTPPPAQPVPDRPVVGEIDPPTPLPRLPRPMLAVLNKAEATVSLLDPASGAEHRLVPVGRGPHEAATSPDGALVVVCNYGAGQPGGTLSVLDTSSGEVLRTIELLRTTEAVPEGGAAAEDGAAAGGEASGETRQVRLLRPHGIRFVDPRTVVVTSEVRQQLALVDVVDGVVVAVLPTRAAGSHMVDVAAGRAYVANIGSGSVSVLDLETRELLRVVPTGAGTEGIAVRPGGSEVWASNRAADTLSVIDTETLEVTATLETAGFPIRVAFTPDGAKVLVSCASAGLVEVWDASERRLLRQIEMDEEPAEDPGDGAEGARLFSGQFGESPVPVGVLVRPDGTEAFVANTQADVLTVLDLRTLRIARRIRTRREPDGMAWIGN